MLGPDAPTGTTERSESSAALSVYRDIEIQRLSEAGEAARAQLRETGLTNRTRIQEEQRTSRTRLRNWRFAIWSILAVGTAAGLTLARAMSWFVHTL